MMKKTTALYSLFLTAVIAVFVVLLGRGDWLETDLKALLPEEQKWSSVQIKADEIQEQALNHQLVLMVGAEEQSLSFQLASQLAEKLNTSGLFSQIFAKNTPNLTALQAEIQTLKWAVLPENIRIALSEQPQHYFQQFAESLANPFAERNLLPLEQDWLGLGRFALQRSQALSKMQWHAETGVIFTQADGKTWTLLRAELAAGQLLNTQADLLEIIKETRTFVQAHQGELLVAGSAIFSAMAKQSAEQESQLMSVIGISLTLILLLCVFRTLKVMWLFLPIGLGMMAGIVATVLCFGKIHILTLVVGTSLIGVLIDFPLHWLSGAKFSPQWHGKQAMISLKPAFLISLMVTLLGYGLLGFTVLPVLKQTALFSAAALVVAIGATMLYLPSLFRHISLYRPYKPWRISSRFSGFLLILVASVSLQGIVRSEWKDDIRQWVALPQAELNEASQISRLAGIDLGMQYFLVTADNDEQLLELNQKITKKLDGLGVSYQALSQWILPETQQKETALQIFEKIRPLDYVILNELGISSDIVGNTLKQLTLEPTVSLQTALATTLGQGWKTLYLGKLSEGKVGSMIKVSNVKNQTELATLADNQQVFWQDKRQHLNESFQAARNQAGWLKVVSFGLAFLLLWRWFGTLRAVKMLAIPFAAILMTISILGWLGLPITLFAMFGLLLVSAIGVDYTTYMATAKDELFAKQFAISLASITTMISFVLLAFSSTPAVASFGISVAVGVLFSVLLTLYFSKHLEKKNENSI